MKIKFNWGTGIVIAIISFMVFIMVMVVQMITESKYNHDFVTDKYYEKELQFQNDIDAIANTKEFSESIRVERVKEGLKVIFPSELNPTEIKGKVFLYRPSNKKLDYEMPISITSPYLLVPEKNLLGGRWNIYVRFEYKGKPYLYQEKLTL